MSSKNLYGVLLLLALPIAFFGVLQLPFSLNSSAKAPLHFQFKEAIVFFGFTNCPSICPTTMSQLASAQDQSTHPKVQVLFINTTEGLTDSDANSYAQSFHSSFQGVQWPLGGKTDFEQKFNIKLAANLKNPGDHSTEIYLISNQNSLWTVKKVYQAHPPQVQELIKLLQGEGTTL